MESDSKNNFFNKIKLFFASDKFQNIFYPCLYFLLTIGVVFTGCFVFQRNYYTNVYVSGSSMSPTLIGGDSGRYHYGISDNHRKTITTIERFDVVVTYYPNSWGSSDGYKIKRVWGFPGEKLTMTYENEIYNFQVSKQDKVIYTVSAPVSKKIFTLGNTTRTMTVATFETEHRTFNTHVTRNENLATISYERKSFNVELKENEYFLMGDNWGSSSDSYSNLDKKEKVSFENLQGKVIAIQGTAKLNTATNELYDRIKIKDLYYF